MKLKDIIRDWLLTCYNAARLNKQAEFYKEMEQGSGFAVHMAGTYPMFTPYLKGVHLTLNGWQEKRDLEGWKYSTKEWTTFLEKRDSDNNTDT
eukprot:15237889-Ditylum_brightwellii.AAC.1